VDAGVRAPRPGGAVRRATAPAPDDAVRSRGRRPFRIVGSSLGRTKAQSCGALTQAGLEHLVGRTFSCDGFQRVAGRPQCRTCTSCLLRRQAIHAAGLAQHDRVDRYRFDVTDPNHRPWSALIGAFPSLWELESRADDWRAVGGPGTSSATLVDMYRACVDEWTRFPVVPPHGWSGSDRAAAPAA